MMDNIMYAGGWLCTVLSYVFLFFLGQHGDAVPPVPREDRGVLYDAFTVLGSFAIIVGSMMLLHPVEALFKRLT